MTGGELERRQPKLRIAEHKFRLLLEDASSYHFHMTGIETLLLNELRGLERAVSQMPGANLRPHLAELDRLLKELPSEADPELRHFLQRRSYEKARLFLEGRSQDIQRGGCTRTQG